MKNSDKFLIQYLSNDTDDEICVEAAARLRALAHEAHKFERRVAELEAQLQRAREDASRLRFPDNSGG